MAVDLSLGNILMCRLEFALDTDRAFNILHYVVSNVTDIGTGLPSATAIPAADIMPGLASQMALQASENWKVAASDDVICTGATLQNVYPAPRGRPFTHTLADPVEGENEGEALPLQDTVTILKRSDFGERWGLGRVFYVGLPESSQNKGYITGGAISQLTDFTDWLESTISITVGGIGVQLRPVLFTDVGGSLRITPVTSCELSNSTVKTQRRRRPGKGI